MPSAGWCRFARLLAVILCPAASQDYISQQAPGHAGVPPSVQRGPFLPAHWWAVLWPRQTARGPAGWARCGRRAAAGPGGVVAGAPRSHRGMGCRAAAWREVLSVSAGDVRGSGLGERCGGRGRWGVGGLWRAAGRAWPRGAAAAGISPWGGHALCFALPCLVSIP